MIPWEKVDEATAPGGGRWELARRGDEWAIRAGGRLLMSSRSHGSEEALAEVALTRAGRARAVLIGGLGMGFTLREALDRLPAGARVVVSELVPAVVRWNRGPLAALAGAPLEDPRVTVFEGDVLAAAREHPAALDAILLDVDNGPATRQSAVGRPDNGAVYGEAGLRSFAAALAGGGVLAVWSAGPAPEFLPRLAHAGLAASEQVVRAREHGRVRHHILLGVRASRPAGRPRPGAPRRA